MQIFGLFPILFLVILAGVIYLNHIIAKKFEEIVFEKGYGTELNAYHMCFWLGVIGYLYVIALPNKKLNSLQLKQQKRILEILEKSDTLNKGADFERKEDEKM